MACAGAACASAGGFAAGTAAGSGLVATAGSGGGAGAGAGACVSFGGSAGGDAGAAADVSCGGLAGGAPTCDASLEDVAHTPSATRIAPTTPMAIHGGPRRNRRACMVLSRESAGARIGANAKAGGGVERIGAGGRLETRAAPAGGWFDPRSRRPERNPSSVVVTSAWRARFRASPPCSDCTSAEEKFAPPANGASSSSHEGRNSVASCSRSSGDSSDTTGPLVWPSTVPDRSPE